MRIPARLHARRPSTRRLAGALAAVLVAPLVGAPPALADATAPTCGSFSAAEVSDFVATWSAHLDDDTFLKSYLGGNGA
ncbi:MAG: hypothetical protein ACTHMS_19350, partial [Jatrophihabitans sp.]